MRSHDKIWERQASVTAAALSLAPSAVMLHRHTEDAQQEKQRTKCKNSVPQWFLFNSELSLLELCRPYALLSPYRKIWSYWTVHIIRRYFTTQLFQDPALNAACVPSTSGICPAYIWILWPICIKNIQMFAWLLMTSNMFHETSRIIRSY
jgi:hypothetical protein